MENAIMSGTQFVYVAAMICLMVLVGWIWFFRVVQKSNESVSDVLLGTSFLQSLTIIAVVIATALLGLTGVLKGELVSTLLGSIAGYVLGTTQKPRKTQ